MGLFTRKEFAALCHTTVGIVNTNVNRGKIILFDKKIDSENPINKAFFEKYYKKSQEEKKKKKTAKEAEEKVEELYNEVVEKASKKIVFKKKTDTKNKERKKAIKKAESIMTWEERKKKADALLQERKAEQAKLQLEKMAGKLLPTEVAFDVVRVHNQSIFATFQNDIENQASIFCDILAGGDRKMLAKLNEKLSELLTACIERAEEVAISGIENAIEKYAETRNRGEKK